MSDKRFSLEEFKALFPGRFESQEQLLREYRSFLAVFERLDQMPAPELSDNEKAEIFRRSWQGRRRDKVDMWAWLSLFRRPTVTFAAGIVVGCAVMFLVLSGRSNPAGMGDAPTASAASLTVEHVERTQVLTGRAVEQVYPDIENPRIVLEKAEESSPPRRVLYGTLDDGEVYVVWNL